MMETVIDIVSTLLAVMLVLFLLFAPAGMIWVAWMAEWPVWSTYLLMALSVVLQYIAIRFGVEAGGDGVRRGLI